MQRNSFAHPLLAVVVGVAAAMGCLGKVEEIPGRAGSGGSSPLGVGGNIAPQGSAGTTGVAGTVGTAGTTGAAGSGPAGTTGNPGSAGSAATTGGGGTGSAGTAGTTGSAGTIGGAGTSGNAGRGGTTGGTGGATGRGGTAGSGSGTAGTGGTTGSAGQGGTGNVMHPPMITNGQQGWGSRYWDCCKASCGWKGNTGGRTPAKSCNEQNMSLGASETQSSCSGGGAYMCWDQAPWEVDSTLAYGYVAHNDNACGRCYQLQFTGSSHNGGNNSGTQALNGKTMIVQVTNIGGIEQQQFDILIPGGGVGANNACSRQWGTSDLGATYGGFLAGCNGDKNCVRNKCTTIFANKADLLAGCNWFLGWFNGADNPNFVYQRIACPAAITQRSGLSDPGN